MSGKKYRAARQVAYKEAVRQKLWQRGLKEIYSRFLRRLIAWLFPKAKKRYTDTVGRWYRRNLKRWSHQAYANQHDPELREFERARRKINRAYMKRRARAH